MSQIYILALHHHPWYTRSVFIGSTAINVAENLLAFDIYFITAWVFTIPVHFCDADGSTFGCLWLQDLDFSSVKKL